MRIRSRTVFLVVLLTLSSLSARLNARATLPETTYIIIDLSEGPEAEKYPVRFKDEAPEGGWAVEHKTVKLVLRRITAGEFFMGSPPDETGRQEDEKQHPVTLTRDYFIGVFPVTQRQWERVMGAWPSYYRNPDYRDSRPVERVRYHAIRGASEGAGWPDHSRVDAGSFLGRLRVRTGLSVDLPTEAQWEYAARAGTAGALNTGKDLEDGDVCPNMAEAGRYRHNGGKAGIGHTLAAPHAGTAVVGSYLPNAWGLYDIHGNVWEWCLDWYGETYPESAVDPTGPDSGSRRVFRGGHWRSRARDCRSAYRNAGSPGHGFYYGYGLRLCLPEF